MGDRRSSLSTTASGERSWSSGQRPAPSSHMRPRPPVAFEIDQYDPSERTGWSVMVQGIARDVTESGDDFSWFARGVEAYPAAPGTKVHRIAIDPITITGRRFAVEG